jgi:hypothetical protein
MAGGTICFRLHRKLIHRESSRASVLNPSGGHAVLHSIAKQKCLLTTPSLLSKAIREFYPRYGCATRVANSPCPVMRRARTKSKSPTRKTGDAGHPESFFNLSSGATRPCAQTATRNDLLSTGLDIAVIVFSHILLDGGPGDEITPHFLSVARAGLRCLSAGRGQLAESLRARPQRLAESVSAARRCT